MALFDVSGFKLYSELREQILPAGRTHLVGRTNHYSFGTKSQEFAVPLGVDVSIMRYGEKYIHWLLSGKCGTSMTRQTRRCLSSFTRMWVSLCLRLIKCHIRRFSWKSREY